MTHSNLGNFIRISGIFNMIHQCALRKQVNESEYIVFVQIHENASEFRITCAGTPPPDAPAIVSNLNMRFAKHHTAKHEAHEAYREFIHYMEETGWVRTGPSPTSSLTH